MRTDKKVSRLDLGNGAQVTLGMHSAAAVFDHRIELQAGVAQAAAPKGFDVDALGFRISPAETRAVARVAHEGPGRILVTPIASDIQVSRKGVLVARWSPGKTYFFEEDREQGSGQQGTSQPGGGVAKSALSTGVKWGIAAGVAAGAAIGLGVLLSEPDSVSSR